MPPPTGQSSSARLHDYPTSPRGTVMRFKSVLVNVALMSVLGLPAHAQGPTPAPAAPLPPPTKTLRPVTNFVPVTDQIIQDRKSTRLNSSHRTISYAVFCLKKK